MAEKDRDPDVKAHQEIYSALKGLDVDTRQRVLSSVLALLGMPEVMPTALAKREQHIEEKQRQEIRDTPTTTRPVSLIELIKEKLPTTNSQRIAVFAHYREKYEGKQRFARDDLKPYFAKAKLHPSSNYDRDFVEAVRKGWVHEEGDDSYLTSKGVEAVEASFPGERKYLKATGRGALRRTRGLNSKGVQSSKNRTPSGKKRSIK
ncbi:MAG: hypothetical protein L0220_03315 [Acidobacteria bacterium]|nr:hypothetical protein [Acidobacteriota bacterium]